MNSTWSANLQRENGNYIMHHYSQPFKYMNEDEENANEKKRTWEEHTQVSIVESLKYLSTFLTSDALST